MNDAAVATAGAPPDRDAVRRDCARSLFGHRPRDARAILADLAASPHAALPADSYGEGENIAALERDVAARLGKAAGMFVVKGVVAQQASLRAHVDRSGIRTVALHPSTHLDLDERNALERLHGIALLRVGDAHRPFTADDLDRLAEPLGAVTVELPLRRAGYLVPDWGELEAIAAWCRARNVPLHLDGARLWEVQPWYGRDLAAIASHADSVYVSFYKGLGAPAGALLAGTADHLAAARVWHARHCGPLPTAFPFVIGARDGLDRHLPRMAAFHRRAVGLAGALATIEGVATTPSPPRSNAFRLHLPRAADALEAAHLALAAKRSVWLFPRFAAAGVPGHATAEISIGDAADDLTDEEIVTLVRALLTRASSR